MNFDFTSDKTLKNVLMLLFAVAIIFVVYQMYKNYSKKEGFQSRDDDEKEHFEGGDDSDNVEVSKPEMMPEMMATQQNQENPVMRDMQNAQMMGMGNDQLTAKDLLPQDQSSVWAQVNPEGQGTLADKNFLQAGYHIGINTVGQTLRNANYSFRSEIPNPQVKVSPWMQSTIDPDVGRKPLEIGAGY